MTGGAGNGGGTFCGGTFCRFTVGRPGTAATHLRYISRESAVLEREQGVLLHRVPEALWRGASTYAALRDSLIAYAWTRAAVEGTRGRRGQGRARTHYRLLVSFEQDVPTPRLHHLLRAWLEAAVPGARAIGFVHRDTVHPHAHLFIEARGVDGRQLDFSARAWRQLDEVWNRLYARHLGRDAREHLAKKQQTQEYKRALHPLQHGEPERDRPARASRALPPAAYRERDRRAAGALETDEQQPSHARVTDEQGQDRHGRDTTRAGGDQRATAGRAAPTARRERVPSRGEPAPDPLLQSRDAAAGAAERALSETGRLRDALARLGSNDGERTAAEERQVERGVEERDVADELERER